LRCGSLKASPVAWSRAGEAIAGDCCGFAIATAVLLWSPQQIAWLSVAITLGYVVHLLRDGLTTAGMPRLWPWHPRPPLWWQGIPILDTIWKPNGYFAPPVLGNVGSFREWLLCGSISICRLWCRRFRTSTAARARDASKAGARCEHPSASCANPGLRPGAPSPLGGMT